MITGREVAEVCRMESRCYDCPLREYRREICFAMIADMKVASTPQDIDKINKMEFTIDHVLWNKLKGEIQ